MLTLGFPYDDAWNAVILTPRSRFIPLKADASDYMKSMLTIRRTRDSFQNAPEQKTFMLACGPRIVHNHVIADASHSSTTSRIASAAVNPPIGPIHGSEMPNGVKSERQLDELVAEPDEPATTVGSFAIGSW